MRKRRKQKSLHGGVQATRTNRVGSTNDYERLHSLLIRGMHICVEKENVVVVLMTIRIRRLVWFFKSPLIIIVVVTGVADFHLAGKAAFDVTIGKERVG